MKTLPIIAIVGRANVGKSSLFNSILERREAIVAREPGTTRDNITARVDYKGRSFWLVDTAGLKSAEDDFELTIQEQILEAIDSADVIWVTVEANIPITDEDRRIASIALKSRKPVFLVVNKIDKATKEDINFERLGIKPIFLTTTTQNQGIEALLEGLIKTIPKVSMKRSDDKLNLALLGRPNVGKSLLFNTLAKKQQAIVSSRAGTTRDINRVSVEYKGRSIEIMDTAGIRRPGRIERGVEHFSVLRSLNAIEQSDICLLLMDVNELNVQLDQKIAGMVKEAGKGLILVVTKWDILEEKTPFTWDQIAKQVSSTYDFVPWAPLIVTSSVTGQNITDIFDIALDIDKRRHLNIRTTELNRWLQETINKHPPAGLKNRSPKLNYMVQETDNPTPAFKIFGSQTKFIHWSYRRFLERELRERYDFSGTALQLWFIEKHEAHRHGVSPTKERKER
ncbi:MAG TPA: ribosome biogenesis GTPase Der [Candidatus Saccharimonadales bacterium]|nr:ribosome biogenesis GTPase Der [Candidatus Saccharimonadales bacterium]